MTTFWLKMIAIITMAIDHTGAVFFPGQPIFRIIGRIAFPIFAFLIAEGAYRTKDIKKYSLRMFVFAIISEIPFDLAFEQSWFDFKSQNVMWTFFWALLAIACYQKLKEMGNQKGIYLFSLFFIFGGLAQVMRTDYGSIGVLIVLLFYYFRERKIKYLWVSLTLIFAFGLPYTIAWGYFSWRQYVEAAACLALPIIMTFNGKKGPALKYFFYIFYPAHLLLIGIIAKYQLIFIP